MTREREFCDSLVIPKAFGRTTRRADGACFYLKEFTPLKTSAGRAGAKLADRGRGTPLYRALWGVPIKTFISIKCQTKSIEVFGGTRGLRAVITSTGDTFPILSANLPGYPSCTVLLSLHIYDRPCTAPHAGCND